jgi:hypothetical protein
MQPEFFCDRVVHQDRRGYRDPVNGYVFVSRKETHLSPEQSEAFESDYHNNHVLASSMVAPDSDSITTANDKRPRLEYRFEKKAVVPVSPGGASSNTGDAS